MSCDCGNNNCNECQPDLGCLSHQSAECILLNDCDLTDILELPCGDNMENVVGALITLINNSNFPTASLGALCIDGGDPFDAATWLENLEQYLCDLNPIVNVEINLNTLTFTYLDATTLDIDLSNLAANVQDTIFVDSIHGNDLTGERENRNKPFLTVSEAILNLVEGDVIQLINSNTPYDIPAEDIAASDKNLFTFHLEQGTSTRLLFTDTVLNFNGKSIEFIGRESLSNELEFVTASNHWYHNFNLVVKNIETVEVNELSLRADCTSIWEDITTINGTRIILSDNYDQLFDSECRHLFKNINIINLLDTLAILSAPPGRTYYIDIKNVEFQSNNNFIVYTNNVSTDFNTIITIVDSIMTANDDFFNDSLGKRNKFAFDTFKNATIQSGGIAYNISDEHQGSIKFTNVRFFGSGELKIDQTDVNLVDAELQDVWSNQYPSNPLTSRTPTIEFLHIDGEDSIVYVNTTPYNVGTESTLIIDSTIGDITVNLPLATRSRKELTIIGGGGPNNMILTPQPGETINGAASKSLNTVANHVRKLKSDGVSDFKGYATMIF